MRISDFFFKLGEHLNSFFTSATESSAVSAAETQPLIVDQFVLAQRAEILRDAFGQNSESHSNWKNQSPLLFSPLGILASMTGCVQTFDLYKELSKPSPPRVQVKENEIDINLSVYFYPETAEIHPVFSSALYDVAEKLKEHPEIIKVEIQGYSGNSGNEEINLQLSTNRANAVKAYLIEKGIDPLRLSSRGLGKTESAGLIEIKILEKK